MPTTEACQHITSIGSTYLPCVLQLAMPCSSWLAAENYDKKFTCGLGMRLALNQLKYGYDTA